MTITRTHPCDGTIGAQVSEGFDSVVAPMVYVSGGYDGGQAANVAANVTSYVQDFLTVASFTGFYLRIPSLPTGNNTFAYALNGTTTGVAAAAVRSNGTLQIYANLGNTQGTGTYALAANTWYRIEWRADGSGQELRLYAANGTTPLDTITGGTNGNVGPDRWRWGHPQGGARAGPLDFDQINLADDWPNLGAVANASNFFAFI